MCPISIKRWKQVWIRARQSLVIGNYSRRLNQITSWKKYFSQPQHGRDLQQISKSMKKIHVAGLKEWENFSAPQ